MNSLKKSPEQNYFTADFHLIFFADFCYVLEKNLY